MGKLYSHKVIKTGFIVICSHLNFYQIKNTINSIKASYPDSKHVCILPSVINKDKSLLEAINKISPIVTSSENGLLSLMNEGLKNAPSKEWNFVVRSGCWIKGYLDKKYSFYIENEKELLFPFIKGNNNFAEVCMNGFLIHKKAIDELGKIESVENFELSKLAWTNKAIELGYRFKSIYGLNFM